MRNLTIGSCTIGPGHPCFIIAEAGVNHNGDIATARKLIEIAASAGADAVKFQTWITEKVCRPGSKKAEYQKQGCTVNEDQYAMLKRLELPYAWHADLKAMAEEKGLVFLSTPDEIDSARFLCNLGVPALKIGSGELTNLGYLRRLAMLGKPLILSTGMGSKEEVAKALDTIRAVADLPLALLHCVSAYPAPEGEMNLRCISTLREAFDVPVGLSDHTRGSTAAVLGVALGMSILEKHITLDHNMDGPDHSSSADPSELADLVRLVRKAETMIGSGEKQIVPSEINTRKAVRRILFYASDFHAGYKVTEEDFEALRSGDQGLQPHAAAGLGGRTLIHAVHRGDIVMETDFR